VRIVYSNLRLGFLNGSSLLVWNCSSGVKASHYACNNYYSSNSYNSLAILAFSSSGDGLGGLDYER